MALIEWEERRALSCPWAVRVALLKGATLEEAIENIEVAMRGWLEVEDQEPAEMKAHRNSGCGVGFCKTEGLLQWPGWVRTPWRRCCEADRYLPSPGSRGGRGGLARCFEQPDEGRFAAAAGVVEGGHAEDALAEIGPPEL